MKFVEQRPFLLEDLTTTRVELKTLFTFDVEPHRMTMVGDDIWALMFQETGIVVLKYDSLMESVVMSHVIHVHELAERKLLFRRTTQVEVRYGVNAIWPSVFGVICACWCGTEQRPNVTRKDIGLVIIDDSGLITDIITAGKYCDVTADLDLVYGFELLHLRLTIHMQHEQQRSWRSIREIAFREEFFRMTLYFDSIFFSGPKLKALLEYQLDTDQKIKHSITYKAADRFDNFWPHVCAVDSVGNLLVCDERNGHVAVLMHDDSWRRLHVSDKIRPCDAIKDNDNNILIMNFDTRTIDKLVIGNALKKDEIVSLTSPAAPTDDSTPQTSSSSDNQSKPVELVRFSESKGGLRHLQPSSSSDETPASKRSNKSLDGSKREPSTQSSSGIRESAEPEPTLLTRGASATRTLVSRLVDALQPAFAQRHDTPTSLVSQSGSTLTSEVTDGSATTQTSSPDSAE